MILYCWLSKNCFFLCNRALLWKLIVLGKILVQELNFHNQVFSKQVCFWSFAIVDYFAQETLHNYIYIWKKILKLLQIVWTKLFIFYSEWFSHSWTYLFDFDFLLLSILLNADFHTLKKILNVSKILHLKKLLFFFSFFHLF